MKRVVSGVWRRIVGCFLTGVLTILPLVITVAVIGWVASFIEGFVGPETFLGARLESLGGRFVNNAMLAYLLGIVFVFAAIFALGMVVQMGFRRLIHGIVEPIVKRIPLAGSVYGAATQIVGLLEKNEDSDIKGMSVVTCFFGDSKSSGLLALLPTPERYTVDGQEYYMVYLPTSPVPMTGGLMFMRIDTVQQVDMSVESLMSIYLSMGVTAPEFMRKYLPQSK